MNKKYGKLDEGVLIFAPINLVVDNMQVINAEEADYLAAGYLPIQYTIKPDDNEWQAVYTEVDGVILQSWVYEGRIHDHSNLPLLEGVTDKSLSGVPAVSILPTDAKDGDMCLYAPQNTLTLADSGKRIYFNWEEFRKPYLDGDGQAAITGIASNEDGTNQVELNILRNYDECSLQITCIFNDEIYNYIFVFNNGEFNNETSMLEYTDPNGNVNTTYYNSIDELPLYVDLQSFSYVEIYNSENPNNVYMFHTEYKLMKYQGGKWTEAVDVPTKTSEFENDSGYITNSKIELTNESTTLEPNTHYSFGEATTLTLEFAEGDTAKVNEYSFTFISGATPTVLTLPSSVQWANELTVEANKRYEISIVDNIGLWCAVDYTAEVSE